MTITEIRARHKDAALDAGRANWFGRKEMRFFNTRIESEVFSDDAQQRHCFVTSDRMTLSEPKRYTVRVWNVAHPQRIDTLGEFQRYTTRDAARAAAAKIAWLRRSDK